jgi:hypothetical protein
MILQQSPAPKCNELFYEAKIFHEILNRSKNYRQVKQNTNT